MYITPKNNAKLCNDRKTLYFRTKQQQQIMYFFLSANFEWDRYFTFRFRMGYIEYIQFHFLYSFLNLLGRKSEVGCVT